MLSCNVGMSLRLLPYLQISKSGLLAIRWLDKLLIDNTLLRSPMERSAVDKSQN